MKRIDLALIAGLLLSVLLSSFTSFARDCDEVRHNVIRLHILANSDSKADQELKLAVRDRILEESSGLFLPAASKEQAEQAAAGHLDMIERIARDEIIRRGYDYPVKAGIVNMFFETREYGDITLPAGRYDAVRVTIGEAKGQNWWCVLFPPLCIPAAAEKLPEEKLPAGKQLELLGSHPKYVPKFAVVEWVESARQKTD